MIAWFIGTFMGAATMVALACCQASGSATRWEEECLISE